MSTRYRFLIYPIQNLTSIIYYFFNFSETPLTKLDVSTACICENTQLNYDSPPPAPHSLYGLIPHDYDRTHTDTINNVAVPRYLAEIHGALTRNDTEYVYKLPDGALHSIAGLAWEDVHIWPMEEIAKSPDYLRQNDISPIDRVAIAGNGAIFFLLHKSREVSILDVETGKLRKLEPTLEDFLMQCITKETAEEHEEIPAEEFWCPWDIHASPSPEEEDKRDQEEMATAAKTEESGFKFE